MLQSLAKAKVLLYTTGCHHTHSPTTFKTQCYTIWKKQLAPDPPYICKLSIETEMYWALGSVYLELSPHEQYLGTELERHSQHWITSKQSFFSQHVAEPLNLLFCFRALAVWRSIQLQACIEILLISKFSVTVLFVQNQHLCVKGCGIYMAFSAKQIKISSCIEVTSEALSLSPWFKITSTWHHDLWWVLHWE